MLPINKAKLKISSEILRFSGIIFSRNESTSENFFPRILNPNTTRATIGLTNSINLVLYFPWNIFSKEKW